MDVALVHAIESNEPDVEFAHLKQATHSAHGQIYVIHICHLTITKQYRAYVFCGGKFIAWILDPELDHSVDPKSPKGIIITEQLFNDAEAEIDENFLEGYTYFFRKNIDNCP